MKLTKEQKHVIQEALKLKKPTTKIGGYAGVGKTTIISHIIKALPNFAVCAYTGKAADVLRQKGMYDASTIHSLIYKPTIDGNGDVYFELASNLDCDGIIVDEASMVSKEIYHDLLYFDVPIIFVGDHGQLEPVGSQFNLMEEPDYVLEKIHRNSGEIAHFAEFVRKGNKPSNWISQGGDKVQFISMRDYAPYMTEVDQVICAFNKTRVSINEAIRKQLNRGPTLENGDRVMCLRNNHKLGIFNGMQGIAKKVKKTKMTFVTRDKDVSVTYDPNVFNQIKYEFDRDRDSSDPFDYCYGITCHKAQGDEFSKVLVVEQQCDLWDQKRWSYTAASRAKEQLLWAS